MSYVKTCDLCEKPVKRVYSWNESWWTHIHAHAVCVETLLKAAND